MLPCFARFNNRLSIPFIRVVVLKCSTRICACRAVLPERRRYGRDREKACISSSQTWSRERSRKPATSTGPRAEGRHRGGEPRGNEEACDRHAQATRRQQFLYYLRRGSIPRRGGQCAASARVFQRWHRLLNAHSTFPGREDHEAQRQGITPSADHALFHEGGG